MGKLGKIFSSRLFAVSVLIFIQICMIVLPIMFLSAYYIPIQIFFSFLSLIISISIVNRNNNPGFKIAWLIPIGFFPVGGALLYLMFGRSHLNKKNTEKLKNAVDSSAGIIEPDNELLGMLSESEPIIRREAGYIINNSRSNIYAFTDTEFLNPGSLFFERFIPEPKSTFFWNTL